MSSVSASNLFGVKSLVAVVTGGGTGIGLLMAQALAANGAEKVYIVGRRKEVLEKAAASASTGNIIPVQGDVTSKDSLKSIAERIKSEVGYLNLVVANSGTLGPSAKGLKPGHSVSEFAQAWFEISMEDFTSTYHMNSTSALYTTLAFLPLLEEGNKKNNMGDGNTSQVVITSSIAGYLRTTGLAYSSSKAAATHLAKTLSTQLVRHKIRVNALAPGFFPSELAAPLLERRKKEGSDELDLEFIPAKRLGEEEDMAGTILYLASRAGGYLNGNVVVIDGGRISNEPATY